MGREVNLACLAMMASAIMPATAHADDYGCKVLLCLADPRGPMTEAECRPPIRQLFRDLAKGKPFPTCTLASGPGGRSYASQGYSYYDACPPGTSELAQGDRAARYAAGTTPTTWTTGIGSGSGLEKENDSTLPTKICVGRLLGTAIVGNGDDRMSVGLYDQVVAIAPATSARYIDVYVDDKLLRRVRW
jgi:hypothetical protein